MFDLFTKYGIKDVAKLALFDPASNKALLYADTLKMTSIENKATTTYARGGSGNPKLLGWDTDREATVKIQDALLSMKQFELMSGNTVETGAKAVFNREILTAIAGATGKSKVTLSKQPVGNSLQTFKLGDLATPVTGTASTLDVSFDIADIAVGDQVEVWYDYTSGANTSTLTISADKFPAYVKAVGSAFWRNAKTGADEVLQFTIFKAKISPNFTLSFAADGEPTVFDMDLEIFKREQDAKMYEVIKIA